MARFPVSSVQCAYVLSATLPLLACGDGRPDGPVQTTAQSIVNGTTDTGDPAVMEFRLADANGNSFEVCTAELISPTALLTAGHCVATLQRLNPPGMALISRQGTGVYARAIATYIAPDVTNIGDFGVLVLPAPTFSGITALNTLGGPNSPANFNEATLVGQTVRIIGFGYDQNRVLGVKRSGTAKVQSVNPTNIPLTPNPSIGCQGDSGGPALAAINGSSFIIGTLSTADCSSYNLFTRVSVGAKFLNPFITAPLQNLGRPFWHNDYGYDGTPVGDWANGSYKAQCSPWEAVTGVSSSTDLSHLNSALCTTTPISGSPFPIFQPIFPQNALCYPRSFNPGDNMPPGAGDWDNGYYKAQCGPAEFVAGVAQSTSGQVDSVLCCPGGATSAGNTLNQDTCNVQVFSNGDSSGYQSPDWDNGYYKGQCPSNDEYVAGISAFGGAHALLCCERTLP